MPQRARSRKMNSPSTEIAIIGVALRFPQSNTVEEFFDHLIAGRSLITDFPVQRWGTSLLAKPEHLPGFRGGFIKDADCFDADFFNISPREASYMDPQQRMMLELTWAAIEDAGYRAGALAGSRTGVFMGVCHRDYAELLAREGAEIDAYMPTGTAYSIIANRVSYHFDLHGPSVTHDTACSSSLVAIHQAVAALERGECERAFAGGVNLCWSPSHFIAFHQNHMLSPEGYCKTFDQAADGYVRGEGGAVIMMCPLAQAVADGDLIYGVIRGVGTNHGGRTSSLTVTNPQAQSALISETYRRADINPTSVNYIETHGTGTPVGDPIEILGLKQAFAELHTHFDEKVNPDSCGLGSVKTNIGHLEGAAGMAGVVKVLAAMKYNMLPATLNVNKLNSLIKLSETPFHIITEQQPWKSNGEHPRRAGVSSFGFGGTNAHVVLEEYPDHQVSKLEQEPVDVAIPLSAKNPERLRALASHLCNFLRSNQRQLRLQDVAWTLQTGREPLEHRVVIFTSSMDEFADALADYADAKPAEGRWIDDTIPPSHENELTVTSQRWLNGEEVDWRSLHESGSVRRVRLPTYPFARESHWFESRSTARSGQCYRFPMKAVTLDHRVHGKQTLPGIAHLDLVRVAVNPPGEQAVCLTSVMWVRPLVVDKDGYIQVSFASRQHQLSFEVQSTDGVMFSKGLVETIQQEQRRVELKKLQAACSHRGPDPDTFYRGLRTAGVEHGELLRVVTELNLGSQQVLARMSVNGNVVAALDGALQAATLLDETPGALPFAMDRVEMANSCPDVLCAWIRPGADPAKFDIDLFDDRGEIYFRARGYTTRRAKHPNQIQLHQPAWIDAPAPDDRGELYLLFSPPLTVEANNISLMTKLPSLRETDLADDVEECIVQTCSLIQEILAKPLRRRTRLIILAPEGALAWAYRPLLALLRTANLENSLLDGGLVTVDPSISITNEQLRKLLPPEGVHELCVGKDGRQQLNTLSVMTANDSSTLPIREGGVYWITGGQGGLGNIFKDYLTKTHKAIVVVSGHSAGEFQVDVCRQSDVKRGVETILDKHGRLDGVIHAAGIIQDALLRNKTRDQICAVLAPKLHGTVNILEATRELELDFLVLFSSVASVFGNPGQSDYAAANSFMDALAHSGYAQSRVISVSWPYWEAGGMSMSSRQIESMRRRQGWAPLPTEKGLYAFEQILAAGSSTHVTLTHTSDHTETASSPKSVPLPENGSLRDRMMELVKGLVAESLGRSAHELDEKIKLERYGLDSISIINITESLERAIGPVSQTLLFEHINLEGIVDELLSTHGHRLADADNAPKPAVPIQRNSDSDNRDIAIIGIAGRYPGADTLDELWALLKNGRHCFDTLPPERWDNALIHYPERDIPGKSVIHTGTFLREIDCFDPRYFNISQREAELMSPEVRLFLQLGVHAFEDAGYSKESMQRLFGGDVAVIAGTMSNHYGLYGFQNNLVRGSSATGSYTGSLPNMLSYFYGFTGPSIFLDTMCAGSASCIHHAVQLLRNGETHMAIAGGINLLLHPYNLISSSQEHFTSNTSEVVRSYGVGADGTILGEGGGAVILKRLEDAERDGDRVRAVIKGTAATNAGARNGYTVPNPQMQALAISKALEDADVDPRTLSYIEGHGSGTSLGDPIEIKGLTLAWENYTRDKHFCAIGSVKSNLGHLLAAAGVAGLTKVILQLEHGMLCPSLHAEELNPRIPFDDSPFVVQRELTPWEESRASDETPTSPRRAGITSIGAGGMNSHMIIEEYKPQARESSAWNRLQLVVFSAMTEHTLRAYVQRFDEFLADRDDSELPSIAWSLQIGKNELPVRLAIIADSIVALRQKIEGWLNGNWDPDQPAETDEPLVQSRDQWLNGDTVAWESLHPGNIPPRIALPAYPFEKVRCWVKLHDDAPDVLSPLGMSMKLHPFIGENLSDLAGIRYSTKIVLDDLHDYVYQSAGQRRLIPTFVLDLALALGRLSGFADPAGVLDIQWAERASWNNETQLDIALQRDEHNHVFVKLLVEGDELSRFSLIQPSSLSDTRTVLGDFRHNLSSESFYTSLAEMGLEYGPFLRAARSVRVFEGGLEMSVGVPEHRHNHRPRNVTLAAWLQAALLQGAQYLTKKAEAITAVQQLSLSGDAAGAVTIRLYQTQVALHAICVDAHGKPLIQLRGLQWQQGVSNPLQFQAGTTASETALGDALRQMVAELSGFPVHEVDYQIHFLSLGFSSVTLAQLASLIKQRLGVSVNPDLFFEYRNIDELSAWLLKRDEMTLALPNKPKLYSVSADAVAIVGAACRFPGASDLESFWENLIANRDLVRPYPLERHDSRNQDMMQEAGFPQWAATVDGVDQFDADFFGVLPAEAQVMDPQHRLTLEVVWHALEDSGQPPESLPKNTGVFMGISANEYSELLSAGHVPPGPFTGTGNSRAMLVNRLSQLLDVHGPSEAIDTACSSSLVAVHRAVESIRNGSCDQAIAGGVNLLLSKDAFVSAYHAGMLSPSGRCKTFSEHADGYVRGEGAGAVILKPLAHAEQAGDRILGVIIGSAENHGGQAGSLTAPNPRAQSRLIESAMQGIDPHTIGYIEAHGTGTRLGDSIEVRALKNAYKKLPKRKHQTEYCALGSVKTNIGHLEAAAGIAGLLKAVLILQHGEIPASLHCDETNSYLELSDTPFYLINKNRPWPEQTDTNNQQGLRRAGVSSFGFGGTNAHLVIQEYPADETQYTTAITGETFPVRLSALTRERLRGQASHLLQMLAHPSKSMSRLKDIAFTLCVGRQLMKERVTFQVKSLEELKQRLGDYLADGDHGDLDNLDELIEWGDARRTKLPGYPFARQRFWLPSSNSPVEPQGDRGNVRLSKPVWLDPSANNANSDVALNPTVILCGWNAYAAEHLSREMNAHCQVVQSEQGHTWAEYGCYVAGVATQLRQLIQTQRHEAFVQVVVPLTGETSVHMGLHALLRSVRLEHPWLRGQVVAVPGGAATDRLKEALLKGQHLPNETLLRLCNERYQVHRWQTLDSDTDRRPAWRSAKTYLISGGAGGLGLLIAEDIVKQTTDANIVLIGRSPLGEVASRRIDQLCEGDAKVVYRRTDVSRLEDVRALQRWIRRKFGSLQGVVHCAGQLHDKLLQETTDEDVESVLAPKVAGLDNLRLATADEPLEVFLLCSSEAAIHGNQGQSIYAAANAYLDFYAAQPPALMLSINWPLWRHGGMKLKEEDIALMRMRGARSLESSEGIRALHQALTSSACQVHVHLPASTNVQTQKKLSSLQPHREGVRRESVLLALKKTLSHITQLSPEGIDADEHLDNYGLSSLVVTRLNMELGQAFGELSKALFYEHPSLRAVADYLIVKHPKATAAWVNNALPSRQHRPVDDAGIVGRNESLRQALNTRRSSTREPIAIIGVSGCYPGADNVDALWSLLKEGRDVVREIPGDRWSLTDFFEPDPQKAVREGRSYCKWGGFIDEFASFDPLFFGISPAEAMAMDPQERLFLEACWSVLEDAGYTRERLDQYGRRVGVFAGVTKRGYEQWGPVLQASGQEVVPRTSFSSIANRVSYSLNLNGPSLPIDTMCSSSLVALHEACEHIYRGECELAIAGGVNLYLHPSTYVELCRNMMLSPSGRCHSFGAGADGFVPGEGVGCVLLKPLSQARADGDHILASIRATAVNHGGRANGYTVPNPNAQKALIRECLERAGLDTTSVSYVEAHGTGTALGDPIEIEALHQALSLEKTGDRCVVGSIKSNMGHLEAAAGIAGLTKVLLQLQHRTIAPSLHATPTNPNIAFDKLPFDIPLEATPWESHHRIATISSFGAGGTNAHVVVEEYVDPHTQAATNTPQLLVLSARDPERLKIAATRLVDTISGKDLGQLAMTLQMGREAMKERLAIIADNTATLMSCLSCFLQGQCHKALFRATVAHNKEEVSALGENSALQTKIRDSLQAGDLTTVAQHWVEGYPVDWNLLHPGARPTPLRLPTYPFERKRFWPLDLINDTNEVADVPVELSGIVTQALARIVGMSPSEIDEHTAFADYGVDSILAAKLADELSRSLGVTFQTHTLFEHTTVEQVSRFVQAQRHVSRQQPVVRRRTTAKQESIAIVGISARFAQSRTPEELWQHLANGDDLVDDVSRWPMDTLGSACKRGSFIDQIDCFDPLFFNISGVEATYMDPQQRILLEQAWIALEDAGYAGQAVQGLACGTYIGCCPGDYETLLDGKVTPPQALWGNMASLTPSRIAYYLDLKGPALAVDTSCSSSLVALHLACRDLQSGETQMALAGGVFVQSTVKLYRRAASTGMLSPTGRCATFDESADGFVPGEGAGVVVLRRLDDAIKDGDHIYAVIRGTGVNHDGATNGITAPSAKSQQHLLQDIYRTYGINAADIQYVESHGTGTKVGDPIEVEALSRSFQAATDKRAFCALGSIKTNLGHTQYAAGIAGLLKVVLALKHGQIPPTLHFQQANPAIDFDNTPFYVNTQPEPWSVSADVPRCAAVSAFGASGTNAHAVITEAPQIYETKAQRLDRPAYLFVLSAMSREQLEQQRHQLSDYLAVNSELDCRDISYTLLVGRRHMNHRFACLAADTAELKRCLVDEGGELTYYSASDASSQRHQSSLRRFGEECISRCNALVVCENYREDLTALAELFVQGYTLPWPFLFTSGAQRRVPLPCYPFARERYWVKAVDRPNRPGVEPLKAMHLCNSSTQEVKRFKVNLTGHEFFLDEHRVKGEQMLPGVVYLEFVCCAIEKSGWRSTPFCLRDVVWRAPLKVNDDAFNITVELDNDDDGLVFRIYRSITPGQEEIFCEGRATNDHGFPPPKRDLTATAGSTHSPQWVNDTLRTFGIEHGKRMRAITELSVQGDRVIARLECPEPVSVAGYLPPSLLDSAIQASMALQTLTRHADSKKTAIPFAVDEVKVWRSCPVTVIALVYSDETQRVNIDLCDQEGESIVQLSGLSFRAIKPKSSEFTTFTTVPEWTEVPAPVVTPWPEPQNNVLTLGAPASFRERFPVSSHLPTIANTRIDKLRNMLAAEEPYDHIFWVAPTQVSDPIAAQETSVIACFRLVKACLELGYEERSLGWTVLLRPTTSHASVRGFFGSLAQEFPQWRVRLAEAGIDEELPVADLLSLPADPHGQCWRRSNNRWQRRQLTHSPLPNVKSSKLRYGGVYVVIGGAGGIGSAWSEMLIRRYGAQVIWLGRRALDTAIQARIDALATLGPAPRYIQADARDKETLTRVKQEIKVHFPRIHGVVHAAIDLQDQSLAKMDEQRFRAALSTKIDASVAIADVFVDDELDFMLFFSSIQSFVPAPGQSNYASGSTFQDAFALELSEKYPGVVKVINWGYWGDTGTVASSFYQKRMARAGFGSLDISEALETLEALLASSLSQLAYYRATHANLFEIPTRSNITQLLSSESAWRQAHRDPWLRYRLQQLLGTGGLDGSVIVAEEYKRWMQASLDYLEKTAADEKVQVDYAEFRRRWSAFPNKLAEIDFADTALKGLPEVLRGKRLATDVLFPAASMELVEKIYRDNPAASYFNDVLADNVACEVRRRSQGKLRILEVGAGTGATTRTVLAHLDDLCSYVTEYRYTDLSKYFLDHGAQLTDSAPFLCFDQFNVEQAPSAQGIDEECYDIVIAANVLHATHRVDSALHNVRRLLKPGGVLFLNELTGWDLFSHLTFGLLQGWWLYEDNEYRISDCPAVSSQTWRELLSREGFENIDFPVAQAHELGQQIILATRAGTVVQGTLRQRTIGWLTEAVGQTLGLPATKIDSHVGLTNHGMDSLLAIQLSNRLRGRLGPIGTSLLFESESIEGLAGYLLEHRRETLMQALGGEDVITLPSSSRHQPLSEGQTGIWLKEQLSPGMCAFNVPLAFTVAGDIDLNALQSACDRLVQRYPILVAAVRELDSGPIMELPVTPELSVEVISASQLDDDALRSLVKRTAMQPFTLETGPLFRVQLFSVERPLLLLTAHHIACDGTSAAIVVRSLREAYANCLCETDSASMNETASQYEDFVAWEQQLISGPRGRELQTFWKKTLTAPLPVLALQSHLSDSQHHTLQAKLAKPLAQKLDALANNRNTSKAALTLTAYLVLLHWHTGQEEIIVGLPTAGRQEPRYRNSVGHFVNVLPIRTRIKGQQAFEALLADVGRALFAALDHAEYPFAALVRELDLPSSVSPIFQTEFSYQNFTDVSLLTSATEDESGLSLAPFEGIFQETAHGLALELYEEHDSLTINLKHRTSHVSSSVAQYLLDGYLLLLEQLVTRPQRTIADFSFIAEKEREQLLEVGASCESIPVTHCLHDLFCLQVERTPAHPAVIFADRSLSYSELGEQSDELARRLQQVGVGPEVIVGLRVARGVELVVGILGILKAGGAYLPLDPSLPTVRINDMLQDAQALHLIEQDADGSLKIEQLNEKSVTENTHEARPENLAYVMYTSGSTGHPKGVMVEHRNVVRLLAAARKEIDVGPEETWSLCHTFSFDVSVWEMWGAFASGATLVIVPESKVQDPGQLHEFLRATGVTVLNQTPSAFLALMDVDAKQPPLTSLRHVVFAGERLDPTTLANWMSRYGDETPRLINMYGITEITVHATFRRVRLSDVDNFVSPIGRPLCDLSIHLLDTHGKPVPTGVIGEMWVGGAGVTRGYLNRPELTAERFISSPFNQEQLYRSGDLARRLENGELLYEGRRDEQVKVRGYRIELGEVRAALERQAGVKQAAVITESDSAGTQRLVAWVLPEASVEQASFAQTLRAALYLELPAYMVPAFVHLCDVFPLTPNGKLDRAALKKWIDSSASKKDNDNVQRPRESQLQHVMSDLLGVESLTVNDNFFDFGAHSLLLAKAARRIQDELKLNLNVNDLYTAPSVAGLAQLCLSEKGEERRINLQDEAKLSAAIVPINGSVAQQVQHIFLTGGAGYVGRFLIHEILHHTDATITCLVLAKTEQEAREQLYGNLRRHNLWTPNVEQRVTVIAGDLALPRFGLSDALYAKLCHEADCIYHLATFMNHFLDYDNMKAVNVDAMERILDLACSEKQKPLHYISTINVFSRTHERHQITEETPIDAEVQYSSFGYTSTKWVAEKIVGIACQRGIPCNIIRLGLMIGDTQEGRCEPSQWFAKLVRISIEAGAAYRDHGRLQLAMTPVDFAAKAILRIGQSGEMNRIFHVSNPVPVSFNDMVQRYNEVASAQLRLVDAEAFLSLVREQAQKSDSAAMKQFLDLYEDEILIRFSTPSSENGAPRDSQRAMRLLNSDFVSPINSDKTVDWLKAQGLDFPVIDGNYIQRCFQEITRHEL